MGLALLYHHQPTDQNRIRRHGLRNRAPPRPRWLPQASLDPRLARSNPHRSELPPNVQRLETEPRLEPIRTVHDTFNTLGVRGTRRTTLDSRSLRIRGVLNAFRDAVFATPSIRVTSRTIRSVRDARLTTIGRCGVHHTRKPQGQASRPKEPRQQYNQAHTPVETRASTSRS